MKSTPGWMSVRSAIGAVLLFSLGSKAVAQAVVGDPGFAEANNADCMWRSTLTPNPPAPIANTKSDILFNAFKGNPTFTFDQLVFSLDLISISVDQYLAWVNVQPALTCGAIDRPARNLGDEFGGAAICVDFTPPPGGTPPTVHWLQVVRTNAPEENLPPNHFNGDDGFHYFIDNLNSATTLLYDVAGGAADGTNFVDRPFNRCPPECNANYTSTFDLFATQDLGDGKVLVYRNGIEWGFNFQCVPVDTPFQPVPEASTFWVAGGLVLIVALRVFRYRAGRSKSRGNLPAE